MKRWLLPVAAALAMQAIQVHAACPPPADAGSSLTADAVQLAWRADPQVIVVGQPFALIVTVCPTTAQLTRVDATMPEHRHGMNYRPTILALGDGMWRAEGLLWHMSGRWELRLDVQGQGGPQTLRQSVTLP